MLAESSVSATHHWATKDVQRRPVVDCTARVAAVPKTAAAASSPAARAAPTGGGAQATHPELHVFDAPMTKSVQRQYQCNEEQTGQAELCVVRDAGGRVLGDVEISKDFEKWKFVKGTSNG